MATVIDVDGGLEKGAKRIGKDNTADFGFMILSAADEFIALEAIDAYKPASVTVRGVSLVYDEIKLSHVECDIWEADVKYIHPDKQKNEDDENNDSPQLSISTSGSSENITHSLASLRAYPEQAFGKHKQAIGVEKNAKGEIKIKGCSIIVPTMKIKVSAKIPRPADPFAFGRTLARKTGRTNRNTWQGFTKWELLFLGANITGKLREKWALDYEFEGSETINADDGFTIGGHGPIVKEGHAHLWVEWAQVPKGGVYVHGIGISGKEIVPEVVAVHIEQIYWDFNLGDIGL